MTTPLTAIVLTYNEERHIERCIASLRDLTACVVVVDSFSTDRTVEIASRLGALVVQNSWINYATQFNWALDNIPIPTDWCFRIDADEYVTDVLRADIRRKLVERTPSSAVTGFYVNRAIHFGGRRIRWGGCYPIRMLRVF